MPKKGKSKYGAGQVVQGEMITLSVIDWSDTIDDPENWTRGPVLPVGAAEVQTPKKPSEANSRKKRTRRP